MHPSLFLSLTLHFGYLLYAMNLIFFSLGLPLLLVVPLVLVPLVLVLAACVVELSFVVVAVVVVVVV